MAPFEAVLSELSKAGVAIVDPCDLPSAEQLQDVRSSVFRTEFKAALNAFLREHDHPCGINSSATITLQVTDDVGGIVATGIGAGTSDSDVINVTVNATNDPVTGTAPANASVAEDGSIGDRRHVDCRRGRDASAGRHLSGDPVVDQRHADARSRHACGADASRPATARPTPR